MRKLFRKMVRRAAIKAWRGEPESLALLKKKFPIKARDIAWDGSLKMQAAWRQTRAAA